MVSKKLNKKDEEAVVDEQPIEETIVEESTEANVEVTETPVEVTETPVEEKTEEVPAETETPQRTTHKKIKTPKVIVPDDEIVAKGIEIIERIGKVEYNINGSDREYRTKSPAKLRADHKEFTVTKVWWLQMAKYVLTMECNDVEKEEIALEIGSFTREISMKYSGLSTGDLTVDGESVCGFGTEPTNELVSPTDEVSVE